MPSRHKGIPSEGRLDREYPHQVALLQDYVGANFRAIQEAVRSLTQAPRHGVVYGYDADNTPVQFFVYRFREATDATAFAAEFDGLPVDPKKDRVKGEPLRSPQRSADWAIGAKPARAS